MIWFWFPGGTATLVCLDIKRVGIFCPAWCKLMFIVHRLFRRRYLHPPVCLRPHPCRGRHHRRALSAKFFNAIL